MKFITIGLTLSLGMALTSNASTLGEHTINRQGSADFSLERTMPERFDSEDITMAGCIALPDAWEAPSSVTSNGSPTFSASATRYAEGETHISDLHALQDYTWYCYQDSQRSYSEDDSASMLYALASEDSNTTVYSSIGFIEGVSVGPRSVGDFYYQSISSHQVLRDNQAADYYSNLANEMSASDLTAKGFDPSATSYEVIQVDNTTYFLGYSGQSFSIDAAGNFKSYTTPNNARAFYVNGQFIFLISEGNPSILDTHIQFGSELNNLSEAYDIKEVGYAKSLTYDASNNQYVMLNPGTSSAAEKAYYTSTDLITWTANTVGSYQNWQVVFANDGRAVMKNLSLVDSLMSRTAEGDWQAFTHYPSDQYFSTRDILFAHDRFHVLLTEYSNDGSGTVLSSRIGYSDDLTSWSWTTLTTNTDDIASVPTLVELGINQVGIISDDVFYLSFNKGESWSTAKSPLSAISLDVEVEVSALTLRLESLTSINDAVIGTARISTNNNEFSDFIFTTTDGNQFGLIHRTEGPQVFGLNNDVYFYESNRADWAMYKATAASIDSDEELDNETDTDPDDETAIGSLFWFLSILVALGSMKNRKRTRKAN